MYVKINSSYKTLDIDIRCMSVLFVNDKTGMSFKRKLAHFRNVLDRQHKRPIVAMTPKYNLYNSPMFHTPKTNITLVFKRQCEAKDFNTLSKGYELTLLIIFAFKS